VIDTFRLFGNEDCGLARYGNCVLAVGGFAIAIVQGLKVFLKLKGGIKL